MSAEQEDDTKLPPTLIVVAVLFIFVGVWASWNILSSLMVSKINVDLNVIGLPVGIGLLHRNSTAWTAARAITWIQLALIVVVTFFFLAGPTGGTYTFLGRPAGPEIRPFAILMCVLMFAYLLWQRAVLTSESIRALYAPRPPSLQRD